MDVEGSRKSSRTSRPTEKGAQYASEMAAKKNRIRTRIQANSNRFDVSGMLAALNNIDADEPEADAAMDALTAKLTAMGVGGRKRRTIKKKGKKSRKTRKN